MKYIQYINMLIKESTAKESSAILFGQNISKGSCLGGVTRGLAEDDRHWVINTPNIENAQVGIGFGLMKSGVSSVFAMKQLDFLLLGIDPIVNTYNTLRLEKPKAAFTILATIVDLGYQGLQSSLNNLNDFCSFGNVQGFTITNKHDAEVILNNEMYRPGFRIIALSQRLFDSPLIEFEGEVTNFNNGEIFEYTKGSDVTIACFNCSLPQGKSLSEKLATEGVKASLFSINASLPTEWKVIKDDAERTGKLIVLDDSKSINKSFYRLFPELGKEIKIKTFSKENSIDYLRPNSEEFHIDFEEVKSFL